MKKRKNKKKKIPAPHREIRLPNDERNVPPPNMKCPRCGLTVLYAKTATGEPLVLDGRPASFVVYETGADGIPFARPYPPALAQHNVVCKSMSAKDFSDRMRVALTDDNPTSPTRLMLDLLEQFGYRDGVKLYRLARPGPTVQGV